jgi:5-methylcytosine-specific restriction endonuclease McrA
VTTATGFPVDPQLVEAIESMFPRPIVDLTERPTEWKSLGSSKAGPNSKVRRRKVRTLKKRDGALCFYCGVELGDDEPPTLDHVLPNSLVKTWRNANLVLSCYGCNQGKTDRIPTVLMPLLAAFVFNHVRLMTASETAVSETNGDI